MALRDQPYLPLYVQDYLTDEKLRECQAASVGVYSFLLCLMHKSDEYGTILLKQKDKQTSSTIKNFACKLLKHLPYKLEIIEDALTDLLNEKVLLIDGDKLIQKRMIRDNEISNKRSLAGKEGGKKTQFALANALAKSEAKHENEIEYENEDVLNKGGVGENVTSSRNKPPTLEEVIFYFTESGYPKEYGQNFYSYYAGQGWETISGKSIIKNWQAKVLGFVNNQKQFQNSGPNNKSSGEYLKLLPRERDAYWFGKYPKDQKLAAENINKMLLVLVNNVKYWVMPEDQQKHNLELWNKEK